MWALMETDERKCYKIQTSQTNFHVMENYLNGTIKLNCLNIITLYQNMLRISIRGVIRLKILKHQLRVWKLYKFSQNIYRSKF